MYSNHRHCCTSLRRERERGNLQFELWQNLHVNPDYGTGQDNVCVFRNCLLDHTPPICFATSWLYVQLKVPTIVFRIPHHHHIIPWHVRLVVRERASLPECFPFHTSPFAQCHWGPCFGREKGRRWGARPHSLLFPTHGIQRTHSPTPKTPSQCMRPRWTHSPALSLSDITRSTKSKAKQSKVK